MDQKQQQVLEEELKFVKARCEWLEAEVAALERALVCVIGSGEKLQVFRQCMAHLHPQPQPQQLRIKEEPVVQVSTRPTTTST